MVRNGNCPIAVSLTTLVTFLYAITTWGEIGGSLLIASTVGCVYVLTYPYPRKLASCTASDHERRSRMRLGEGSADRPLREWVTNRSDPCNQGRCAGCRWDQCRCSCHRACD